MKNSTIKKALCLMLTLLLAVPAIAAVEPQRSLVEVHCENQGFSTVCLDNQRWEEPAQGGLILWLEESEKAPFISIFWDKGADKSDPEGYFENLFTPLMRQNLGERLLETSPYRVYDVEGISMPGVQYPYLEDDGRVTIAFRLLDTRWEGIVAFTAVYDYEQAGGEPMNACARAVKLFNPDAADAVPSWSAGCYRISAAPDIVPSTAKYASDAFTAQLPEGWVVETGGLFENFAMRCYDPDCPERCVFLMSQAGPMLKSQAAKSWWMNYPNPFNLQKPLIDNAIVLPEPSVACFIGNMEAYRAYLETVYPMHLSEKTQQPGIVPDIGQVTVWQTEASPALQEYLELLSRQTLFNTFPDASIVRFGCTSSRNVPCEGMAGGVVIDTLDPQGLNPSLDVWFYFSACIMGMTAPSGELQALEPTLWACLESFRFTDEYLRQARQSGQVLAQLIDLDSSWAARDRQYDILSQKYSDATLGYDRLYDSQTGEVYRAELGFYDGYDLNRDGYENPNLYKIDDGTQSYYLQNVDYYITG